MTKITRIGTLCTMYLFKIKIVTISFHFDKVLFKCHFNEIARSASGASQRMTVVPSSTSKNIY